MSVAAQLRLLIPWLAALLLLLLSSAPLNISNLPLMPHVVWLMSLSVGMLAPKAWPVLVAFMLGLLSDLLLGTPLGMQALLTLLVVMRMHRQSRHLSHQPFRARWLEASLMLLVLFILSWALLGLLTPSQPPLVTVVMSTAANMLWYPLFYALAIQLVRLAGVDD
jgi:rod shape-determining protein MreD